MKFTRSDAINLLNIAALVHLSSIARADILMSDWWGLEENDAEFLGLPLYVQSAIKSEDEPSDPLNKMYEPLILVSLAIGYIGVRNEFIVQKLRELGYPDPEIEGDAEAMFACPCCSYKTLLERGNYYICPICFWEDEGNDFPGRHSGPNHMTLGEARANFAKFGACSLKAKALVDPQGRLKYVRDLPTPII